MLIKLFRTFIPGMYLHSQAKLNELKIKIVPKPKIFLPAMTSDQGIGRIVGRVRKSGAPLAGYKVVVFKAVDNAFLNDATTNANGEYMVANLRKGMECNVVVFPSDEDKADTNARIKTQIIAG